MNTNHITVTHYAEHTDDPGSWGSPRPGFDLAAFDRELGRRGGSVRTVPRFRCVWGGDADAYLIDEHAELKGYEYRANGETRFVPCSRLDFEFPDGAVVTPVFDEIKIFTPRFIVEEFREGWYRKLWAVEEVEIVSEAYGRVDLLSHYREPAEIDLQMAEGYARAADSLTPADFEAMRIASARAKAKAAADRKAALAAEIAEETVRALTDGLPHATRFGFDPNLRFDIRRHTKNLIKEHDSRI